jgi:hypothetical protein
MPILEKLFDSIGDSNNCGSEARLELDCGRYEGSQKNGIPWKQQVVGMACDAFWIEECTCLPLANHGPGFRKGKFLEMLHK